MRIGIPKERREGETRVATSPEVVKKLKSQGVETVIEAGAGDRARFHDPDYLAAGATVGSVEDVYACDIVVKVTCPLEDELAHYREGVLSISLLDPFKDGKAVMENFATRRVNAIGLELIPRITRSQSMDVLSSQANLAGYRAVIEAAAHMGKIFPMMMTAAGSVPATRALICGAGVAGLQAIATAKRLGARVEAFDVRPEVAEQVMSVGAKWLDLGIAESGAGTGGYAKELSEEGKKRQLEALTNAIPQFDLVITTALIPGRPAPLLVAPEAVEKMKPGSVIVDMAAANGGNCPLTEAGKVVVKNDVTLIGYTNLPAQVPNHSSQFFARNILNLMQVLIEPGAEGAPPSLKMDFEDEIVDAATAVYDGEKRWPRPKKEKG